jgi:hypothetical protein
VTDVDQRLDGNAAAGLLAEIFSFDITTAVTVCAGCGLSGPVAKLLLYAVEMGAILRCPGCDTALIRASHLRDTYWLDLSGTRVLRAP